MTDAPETENDLLDCLQDNDLDFATLTDFASELAPLSVQKPLETAVPKSNSLRRVFDPNLLKQRAAVEKMLQSLVDKQLMEMIASNPAFNHAGLRLSVKAAVGLKATPQAGNVIRTLLQRILSTSGAGETQMAIRAYVQSRHEGQNVYKDWTKVLPAWAIKEAKKFVLCSGLPFNQLKINSKMSLRDIHAAAKDALVKSMGGISTYKAEISFADDCLIVNGTVFKITKNKSGGKEYSIVRLNVDSLRTALAG